MEYLQVERQLCVRCKKNKKKVTKQKKKAKDTDAFAIIAGSGAANEEIMANERDIRTKQIAELFMSHTRHKVRMQA